MWAAKGVEARTRSQGSGAKRASARKASASAKNKEEERFDADSDVELAVYDEDDATASGAQGGAQRLRNGQYENHVVELEDDGQDDETDDEMLGKRETTPQQLDLLPYMKEAPCATHRHSAGLVPLIEIDHTTLLQHDAAVETALDTSAGDVYAATGSVRRSIAARQSDYHLGRFRRSLSPPRASAADVRTGVSYVDRRSETRGGDGASPKKHLRDLRTLDDAALRAAGKQGEHAVTAAVVDVPSVELSLKDTASNLLSVAGSGACRSRVDKDFGTESVSRQESQYGIPRKRSRWTTAETDTAEAPPSSVVAVELEGSLVTGSKLSTGSGTGEKRARKSRWESSQTAQVSGPPPQASTSKQDDAGSAPLETEIAGEPDDTAWTEDELNALLPSEGFVILLPPEQYVSKLMPRRDLSEKKAITRVCETDRKRYNDLEGGSGDENFYSIPGAAIDRPEANVARQLRAGMGLDGIPLKPEDHQLFSKLFSPVSTDGFEPPLSDGDVKEREVLSLLLKIKNSGSGPVRKACMRKLSERVSNVYGPELVFNALLPLFLERMLEDGERHVLMKTLDRIILRLGLLVRPYVHKILVVSEPLLIDENEYVRGQGRQLVSNLARTAGLPSMISAMRPDLDHSDEYVRNTTARTLAVIGQALGIPLLLPFLRAVCRSKKSWHARHTGVKAVQQLAQLNGSVVLLPHLHTLVELVSNTIEDEQMAVRVMSAMALSSLADAVAPFGIEAFERVLKPVWLGVRQLRGRMLCAFLRAVGSISKLMHPEHASYYTREMMPVVVRELAAHDEEMRLTVLQVLQQACTSEGVDAEYLVQHVVPEFFRCFWVRKTALSFRADLQSQHQQVRGLGRMERALQETTLELARRVGGVEMLRRLVDDLKDESEPFRRLVARTVARVVHELQLISFIGGDDDDDDRLKDRVVDGLLFAFQEQQHGLEAVKDNTYVHALDVVLSALGARAAPYLVTCVGMIKWRLNNSSALIREQAADFGGKLAVHLHACSMNDVLIHMGTVFCEYLGEEYPEVLGSILGALRSIAGVFDRADSGSDAIDSKSSASFSMGELLPRLTPILKNRHEKVQENCIGLIGIIAERSGDVIVAREWIRICFEMLDLLKAPRMSIRRIAVRVFGVVAKAVGASQVLGVLLNNLKVQERQQRVCTTVAIAIVADQCEPYAVVPYLMHEYRTPELHAQTGVLKSFSFLFEYIGPVAKDYVYAVTPLLQDALVDRDAVHRQTACSAVAHLALGVRGTGVEDALLHLLNHLWPNIFETSPHVLNAVCFAIDALSLAVGPSTVLTYLLQGLYHPARKVRQTYWKLYQSLHRLTASSMLVAYPRLVDDSSARIDGASADRFMRHELDIVI
ncbi:Splicing factor 3B subunit 1 [Porphyridium purpureum]|uniref:Splicing factor 3B subunit 1 n=1 Tax=Porphyridium purpureum TaxID=35688 RepID=A0A5J4Z5L8_PORPP|nr:Splicing factor 3B subunit 1 [Porphyridium purpureum]|eukprot:POR0715..scf295_1